MMRLKHDIYVLILKALEQIVQITDDSVECTENKIKKKLNLELFVFLNVHVFSLTVRVLGNLEQYVQPE